MKRVICGLLIVTTMLTAVGFSDGPLRRLFFGNRTASREVTRKVCTGPDCPLVQTKMCPGPDCPQVQTYAVTQSHSSRLANGSVVTGGYVFPTEVTGTQRPVKVLTVSDPPAFTPIVAKTEPYRTPPPADRDLTFTSMSDHFIETEATDGFRRSVIKAARAAAKSGTITRRDALRIRVAMFSPAFREQAQDLCVVQMAFSGEAAADELPRKANGEIDQAAIDWDQFASFLERIIPIILDLLIAFGAGA
ncbi:hypothetical protein Mal15_22170 [Stieleria maiorica]|uniref:Uncharacterized protein n=1 Tax=Stieleria maiorica TaxID=2795974 RepID=A0A5B9MCD2_9BACT|nr:hypothetical protein [Stieleria maiorica]QEF98169.1 hypothetical protein Mal15_22170 [Stieleria maiorica]